jgi:hypothetical protein
MAKGTTMEIQTPTGWQTLTVIEAIEGNERRGRCVEYKEPVRVHRAGRNGMAAHAEHLKRNPQCSLSDQL